MELSHRLVDAVCRPKYVLLDPSVRSLADPAKHIAGPLPWGLSPLNPKNRVDSLDTSRSGWRIDGATGCGTRFYAVPLARHPAPACSPLRIFVHLPDQNEWPPALRVSLDAGPSVALRHGHAIARLGIARHICRALDHHFPVNERSTEVLQRLPFGSQLVFDTVAADVAEMSLTVRPGYDVESKMVTVDSLRRQWPDIPPDSWPRVIDLTSLQLVHQVHDTVSNVEAPGYLDGIAVFKSGVASFDHTYHELRFLLTVPPHAFIMPRPLAIVTKKAVFGAKRGVVGFLLRHFPAGSIRDILPSRQRTRTLSNEVKLKWSRQVIAAMLHIHESVGSFYSDLRPDNVLLDEDGDNVVLCDFEQRGNWHEWSAPEVLFRQYAENMRSAATAAAALGFSGADLRYRKLIDGYAAPRVSCNFNAAAESPVEAANRPWFLLTQPQREKAAVYTLGLFVYTLFEGLSNVRKSVSNQWPHDPDIEFPAVCHTPPVIMDIVRRCTLSPYSETAKNRDQPRRLVRVGSLLYPEGDTALEKHTTATAVVVLDTALAWWSNELARAEEHLGTEEWRQGTFGQSRLSLRGLMQALQDIKTEHLLAPLGTEHKLQVH